MEERGGKKEKKRKTTREEDRRWQRLPWPGPQNFTGEAIQQPSSKSFSQEPIHPSPHSPSREPNCHPLLENIGHHSSCGELDDGPLLRNKQPKKNFPAIGCVLATGKPTCYHLETTKKTPDQQLGATWKPGCHYATTWKPPGYHLVATIIIALLSILVRPTVGGKDLKVN